MDWIQLNDINQLREIEELSTTVNCLIFKHSTKCYISKSVLFQFVKDWEYADSLVKPYFLDLIAHRSVSNAVAEKWDIQHESPQVLVIKDGKVVFHTSHSGIQAPELAEVFTNSEN